MFEHYSYDAGRRIANIYCQLRRNKTHQCWKRPILSRVIQLKFKLCCMSEMIYSIYIGMDNLQYCTQIFMIVCLYQRWFIHSMQRATYIDAFSNKPHTYLYCVCCTSFQENGEVIEGVDNTSNQSHSVYTNTRL